ncbi:MAG: hypothetical protein LQ341_004505 [Variospora aurantia]|nr:MAG: hypothetical protein LQ341_004505 [Variospora aurantia]
MQNGSLQHHAYTAQLDNNQQPDSLAQSTSPIKSASDVCEPPLNGIFDSQHSSTDELAFEEGPPSKRQKTTDAAIVQTPPAKAKAPSPPWKKFVPEGPSTFEEDGKRKSARTNRIPLDLQPQCSKRRTRAARNHSSQLPKNEYRGASKYESKSLVNSPHQSHINGKHPVPVGKSFANAQSASPSKGGAVDGANTASDPFTTPPPPPPRIKRAYRRRTLPSTTNSPATAPSTNPHQTRRAVRMSVTSTVEEKVSRTLTNGTRRNNQVVEDDQDEASEDEDEEEEEEDMDTDSDVVVEDNYKPQRLNLRVRLPSAKIQHPEQVPRPRTFSSLGQWLDEEILRDSEVANWKSQAKIRREAKLRRNILEEARPGGLLSREKSSLYAPEAQEEPPRQYAHQDHLVAQMTYFHKLLVRENEVHKKRAKALAYEAADLWKSRQPKTEEEVQQEQEAAYRVVYRQVQKDLQRKWDMITMEVEKRRLQQWEEEQQMLGKQALNKVLEQSTKLLDKRRRRSSRSSAELESNDSREGSDEGLGSSDESDESPDEVNMSSSRSESESVLGNDAVDDDEGLSREQLLRKYDTVESPDTGRSLDPSNEEARVHDPGGPASSAGVTREDHGTASTRNIIERQSPELPVEVDEVDEALMDDSDESTDMGDDMGDSENDAYSGSEKSADHDSEASEEGGGLLGFFNQNELRAAQEQVKILENTQRGSDVEMEEEPSFVPNAAQVQTPSASNSEEPAEIHKLMVATQASESSPLRHLENIESVGHIHDVSLPTTPVSTKPLKTPVPSLLRGTLREYQHFGLDWLAGLYANGTNGILADEMGLGKTIQTISLLAHLAVNHEVWGPHLIIVPTSVMLNWEMEFKKFLPGFKVLTYYGTQEERKQKRQGWISDSERWNVWITSYQLATKDEQVFKRREWHYMVLDEAHNIKNFRSKRWQILLTFNTRARLLLTGTPLQNNLTELWSLLFFLMPADSPNTGMGGFADLQAFSNWFRKPVEQILEHGRDVMDDDAKAIVLKLHGVLRPFLLRRLKADVEKQMPGKYEHVVYCRLSKRQRYLYDGFMSRAQTKETLASGNYLSIINCLMQLRKVCNHPDLFETRQIVTSYAMPQSAVADYEIKELLVRRRLLREEAMSSVDLNVINLLPGSNEPMSALDTIQKQRLGALGTLRQLTSQQWRRVSQSTTYDGSSVESTLRHMETVARRARFEELRHTAYLTSLKSQRRPLYSSSLVERLTINASALPSRTPPRRRADLSDWWFDSSPAINMMVPTLAERSQSLETTIKKFACVTAAAIASNMAPLVLSRSGVDTVRHVQRACPSDAFHEARMRLSIAFPDKRLLQYDCGKLQRLDALLRDLQSGGHRALIFTQMIKVLDILEQFLNIHGHRYLRLDGQTKIEQRQIITERFNNDARILCFISSSRSGGLGINLTGADSVIFYDLDWNPAMDKQCQDRCHRIGQTRDVHIYRFVSEHTIEANILRKANQKRMLDDVVIQEGEFTTDYFNKAGVREMFDEDETYNGDAEAEAAMDRVLGGRMTGKVFEQAEDIEDIAAARDAEKELAQTDAADFDEKAVPSSSGGGATPRTPGPATPGEMLPPSTIRRVEEEMKRTTTLEAAESGLMPRSAGITVEEDGDAEEEEESEAAHVEEFMLRFAEWQLKDVPVQPVVDKGKKKAKKGVEHGVRIR